MKTFLNIPVAPLAAAFGLLQAVTMFTTYGFCVHQGHCPALPELPTISQTWELPPGNFLSRWVVGMVSMMMGLGQFAIYWANTHGAAKLKSLSSPSKSCAKVSACCKSCCTKIPDKVLLVLGVIACFLLSFVGAICDSTVPECRGNDAVHSASAVTFFVLYNFNMVVMAVQDSEHTSSMLANMCALLSLASKVRFLPQVAVTAGLSSAQAWPSGDTILAIFEWSDVFAIILWTVFRIWKTCPNMVASIVIDREHEDLRELDSPGRPLTSVTKDLGSSNSSGYVTATAFTLSCLISISFSIAILVLVVTFACMDYSKGLQFISDGWEQ